MNLVATRPTHTSELVRFNWFITKRCNYDCSYCDDAIHDKISERPSLDKLKYNANNIFEYFSPEKVFFDFTGGEPTLIKEFLEFLEWLREMNIGYISLVTNGTYKYDKLERLLKLADHITISLHMEYVNDKIINKIIKTCRGQNNVKIQITMHAEYFEKIKNVTAIFKRNNINFTIRPIREKNSKAWYNGINHYTDEMLEFMEHTEQNPNNMIQVLHDDNTITSISSPNYMMQTKQNRFNGWWCWAGVKYFVIWFDGTVRRAGCKTGSNDVLGNINTTVNFTEFPIQCNDYSCNCGPELLLPKIKTSKFIDFIDVSDD